MQSKKELVYLDDVRRAILRTNPSVAFCLNGLKPVDAAEVVHSEWVFNKDGSATCKHCHRTTKNAWDYDSSLNFCPDCGADMRRVW